jgi:hypothetical protein
MMMPTIKILKLIILENATVTGYDKNPTHNFFIN